MNGRLYPTIDSWMSPSMLPRCSPIGTMKSGSRMPPSALPYWSRHIRGKSANSNSNASLQRWGGPPSSHVEVAERSAVRGCVAPDVPILRHDGGAGASVA
jgi:hypothetical protein